MSINKTYGYQHWQVRASRWVDILEKNQETTNDVITFESRDCKKTLYIFWDKGYGIIIHQIWTAGPVRDTNEVYFMSRLCNTNLWANDEVISVNSRDNNQTCNCCGHHIWTQRLTKNAYRAQAFLKDTHDVTMLKSCDFWDKTTTTLIQSKGYVQKTTTILTQSKGYVQKATTILFQSKGYVQKT